MNDSLYYCGERRELCSYLPTFYSKVLEIGCGAGGFRSNLDLQHEYWGVEPTDNIANEAANKLDRVLHGTYEQVSSQLPEQYFDLIICNDVIEHMLDPESFMRSVRSKLSSNGVIVGSIPNVRFLLNLYELLADKDWRYKDSGILDRTHLRFFTEKSILRLFNENSFRVEYFSGVNVYHGIGIKNQLLAFFAKLILGRDVGAMHFIFRLSNV